MAKTEENTVKKFETTLRVSDLKKPLTGEYLGSREILTKFGKSKVHKIGSKEIYGTATLDKALETIEEGTSVMIKFIGTEETSQDSFRYLVEVSEVD